MKNLIIAAVTATVISAAMPQAEARGSLNKATSERSGNTTVTLVGGSRIHSVNRGLPRVIRHGTSTAGYKWGTGTKPGRNAWGFSFSAPATGTTKSHAQQKR